MILSVFLIVIWFFILIKWADFLVDWAVSIAKKLKVSDLVIWLTVVAFWTSFPELIVNIFASIQGNTDIAIWNILWSNIANILFILWVSSIIYPITVQKKTSLKEIPFALLAVVALWVLASDIFFGWWNTNLLTMWDWIVLLLFFSIFMAYILFSAKADQDEEEELSLKYNSLWLAIAVVSWWLAMLVVWWKLIVDNAVFIAKLVWISESLIGLTIVAIWTSLPELVTSVVAATKKNSDIAIWNVVWSNIFNIFWILWVSSIIKPLPFWANLFDLIITAIVTFVLFLFMFIWKKHKLEKWQGIIFVISYFVYIWFLIYRG